MPDKSTSIQSITPAVKLLNPSAALAGYRDFIGTYLVVGEKKALVDIGPSSTVPGVLAALGAGGIQPDEIDYIVLTHIHIDHGGGAGTALQSMKNARVLAHARGKPHLVDPAVLWKASLETLGDLALRYGEIEPVPADRIIAAEDGMKLELGRGVNLQVMMTPGHAAHHISLFEPTGGVLFAGDSAGIYSNGALRLTTPPPFRLGDYLASLDRMIALNPRLLCYAHHGCYPDAVNRLRATQKKVRLWYGIAQKGAQAGKTAGQVVPEVREKDRELAYFATLSPDEFQSEHELLVTSIHGLMTAK